MKLLTEPPIDPFCHGEKPVVCIQMLNEKKIRVELDPKTAPITVANFLMLVDQDFYSGLKIHRIMPGLFVQGGDPLGTGDGETDFYVKGEFAENGWDNPISHDRGVISMARQDGCDTASCQFFIMLRSASSMDGHYAAFGHVIEGMDAVDQIGRIPIDPWNRPVPPVIMQHVCIEDSDARAGRL